MVECYLDAIGVAAPGIESWGNLQQILRGEIAYEPTPLSRYTPQSLPANERRRASQLVRLAFRSIEQILSQLPDSGYSSVFCSSGGDYDIFHKICSALALPEKIVSPTQFHNSVHNAPAGYWGIATQNKHPSTTISAFDYSFVMGLVDCVCQLQNEAQQVLLASYDMVPPEPISFSRNVVADFSASFLFSKQQNSKSLCKISVESTPNSNTPNTLSQAALESLRTGNAAARCLGLLSAIANCEDNVALEMDGGHRLKLNLEHL